MSKISIIIPMFNEEMVIEECYNRLVKNLKKMVNYEYEIIFINDGSKDKTFELLKNIASKDKNVKIISFSSGYSRIKECFR